MSDESSLRDDISFLRQMAESGRRGPVLGGIFLVAAGTVFGLTSILSWANRAGQLPFKLVAEGPLWIIASAVFAGIWLITFFGVVRKKTEQPAITNSAFGAIWQALAFGVLTAFGSTILVARGLNSDVVLNAYVPVIYAFYGSAWFASAAVVGRRWMYVAAVGCFAFAFVIALLAESDLQSLVMGIGLLLLLALPGVRMMRDEANS